MSRVNLFFTNVGVSYQVKSFKFSLYYRFINKNQDDAYFSKRHRLYFDAAYKYKFTKLSINYRVRFQGQIRDYYSSEYGRAVESYMRHKFDFSYNLKKYSPYLAAEFRYQFTNPGFPNANGLWNRMRYYAGVDYSFNKRHQVGVYYMIQHDFNNKRLENDFTIGLEYSLSLWFAVKISENMIIAFHISTVNACSMTSGKYSWRIHSFLLALKAFIDNGLKIVCVTKGNSPELYITTIWSGIFLL